MAYDEIKQVAVQAARDCGALILDLSKKPIKYKLKGPRDIQAEGDVLSEKLVVERIHKNFPTHSILSEEMGAEENDSEYLWVIDPIDGTVNFSKGLDDYCVSIAVEHNSEVVVAAVYQPMHDRMYVAVKGEGATLNGEPLSISDTADIIEMVGTYDGNNTKRKNPDAHYARLQRMFPQVRAMRDLGSAVLQTTKVGEGRFDFYFNEDFNLWDVIAGVLIVREAGGMATEYDGSPFKHDSTTMLVSNGKNHEELLKIINP